MKAFETCPGSAAVDGWTQVGFDAASGYVPPLAVGDSVFVRYYHRVLYPQSYAGPPHNWPRIHGDEWIGSLATLPYSPTHNVSPSSATWQLELRSTLPNGAVYCEGGFNQYVLDKNTTYRIEHGIIRTADTVYTIRARIYSQSGSLLYDSDVFTRACSDGQGGQTLTNNTFTGNDNVWNTLARQFQLGLNGVNNLSTTTDEQDVFEWAAFAVCSTWCGAYKSLAGEN